MLKRTLYFSTPINLSLKDNQLVCSFKEAPEEKRTIPIEDIGYVILEDQMINITMPLLNALSDNNVAVIVCNNVRLPNAMLLNLDSNATQSEMFRLQMDAGAALKKNLWKQVVEAKIRNQAALLNKLGMDGDVLKPLYMNVKSGDTDNREGVAAKLYWNALFGKPFIRDRNGVAPNNLLNYGYTILRAAVARALMGSGLFPAFGIFHRNRYNAFPLADDIMEAYRPFVDEVVYELYSGGEIELDKNVKAKLLRVLFCDTAFDKVTRPLDVGLTLTTASLGRCLSGSSKKLSYPMLL
jgi:CRISPR-associated protein Cas1